MNRHRPYRQKSINPYLGISPANRTALGYCYASPNGDNGVIGPRLSYQALAPNGAGGNPTLFSIQHSTFSIPNWTFTFSAKERDTETGLSYFGSRYYSSHLSIWLSVDPMSGKYPSFSPYVYCANNPVKLVDPNGEEIGWVEKADGTIYWDENAHNQKTTKKGDTYLGEEGQRSVGTTVLNYHSDGTYNEQETILIVDWGEDISTEYVRNNKTFKEREADFTNKSADFLQGLYIFLVSPINDLVVLTTSHDLYGNQVTKEDKTWSAIGIATFGSGKTLKILRLSDKVKKTKKIERGVEAVGTGLDIKTGRETYKKNNKRRNNHEKK